MAERAASPTDRASGQVHLVCQQIVAGQPELGDVSHDHHPILDVDDQYVGHIDCGIHTESRGNGYAAQACRALMPRISESLVVHQNQASALFGLPSHWHEPPICGNLCVLTELHAGMSDVHQTCPEYRDLPAGTDSTGH